METILAIDFSCISWLAAHGPDWLTAALRIVTGLGDHGILWIIAGAFLLLRPKTRVWGLALLLALVAVTFAGEWGVKLLVARPRPFVEYAQFVPRIAPPSGFSFPSSHAAASFAAAVVLCRMDRRAGVPACILAALIAFSRVYLLVHFPSDVVAGALLGAVVGLLVCSLVHHAARVIHYARLR